MHSFPTTLVISLTPVCGGLSCGKIISPPKSAETRKASEQAVITSKSYISALTDSYIIYQAKRFDIKEKQYLKTNEKYYVVDYMEVDFIAMKQGIVEYYQVAATVRDQKSLEYELRSLQRIDDYYPKFLLTLDDDPTYRL